MELTFVTRNQGKLKEVTKMLSPLGIFVKGVNAGYPEIQVEELDEVVDFGLNYLEDHIKRPYIIDDSGLFIPALGGFPGVFSAYVFKTIGNKGILSLLKNKKSRTVYFESVVGLMDKDGKTNCFRGRIQGELAHETRGENGFGYDPIFIPHNSNMTFAQMSAEEKNKYSHRARALKKLIEHFSKSTVIDSTGEI